MNNVVTVYAPNHIDPCDSYGLIAHQLAAQLQTIGVYVNALSIGSRGEWDRPVRPSLGGIFLGYPTSYKKHDNPLAGMGRRVAVTMFESSKLPEDWIEPLNKMDAVIVPSHFCDEVFTDSGVTAPIHVVPLGISETFKPFYRPVLPRRPFTFLAIGDRGKRKNLDAVLQAFVMAFGDDETVRLVIKTRDVKDRPGVMFTNPNIDVISTDMTEQQLYEFYCDCDCMVFPSRGEGFGLPPREFAATGGIAIATNWGGLADDIHVWGVPLETGLVPADWGGNKTLEGQTLGVWAEPDIEVLADLMKCIADHNQAYRIRAHHGANKIPGLYSWYKFATAVYDIWRGGNGN